MNGDAKLPLPWRGPSLRAPYGVPDPFVPRTVHPYKLEIGVVAAGDPDYRPPGIIPERCPAWAREAVAQGLSPSADLDTVWRGYGALRYLLAFCPEDAPVTACEYLLRARDVLLSATWRAAGVDVVEVQYSAETPAQEVALAWLEEMWAEAGCENGFPVWEQYPARMDPDWPQTPRPFRASRESSGERRTRPGETVVDLRGRTPPTTPVVGFEETRDFTQESWRRDSSRRWTVSA